MKAVQNNPYRTVGLLVGATAREQERQVKRLKQFIEAEQNPEDDFSFPKLGEFERKVEQVNDAASKLNLNRDKINAALFWFWNGNPITDEAAFDALKSGDFETAFQIWDKLIRESGKGNWKPVTERNLSAYHNCSVLHLIWAKGYLHTAVVAKIIFLESELVNKFILSVADETHKTTKKELELLFLNQLHSEIETNKTFSEDGFIEIVNQQDFIAKEDFLKGVTQNLIEQIQKKIEESKTKRKADKSNAKKEALKLLNDTEEIIKQLNSILGSSNNYSSIADKLAMELFSWGRDYFEYLKDTPTDPSNTALTLFKYANNYATGNIVKSKIDENIKDLLEWIEDKPERERQAKAKTQIEALVKVFKEFENELETIENAQLLIDRCKPYLDSIKNVFGITDEFYLTISTRVAMQAQSYIIKEVNRLQQNLKYGIVSDRYKKIKELKSILSSAWLVTALVGTLDMQKDFEDQRYYPNKASLKILCNQIGIATTASASQPSKKWEIQVIVACIILSLVIAVSIDMDENLLITALLGGLILGSVIVIIINKLNPKK